MVNATCPVWEWRALGRIWASFTPEWFILQPAWDYMRLEHTDFLRSPIFPVVINLIFYFSCNIPYMVMDLMGERWPRVHRYKIQKKVKVGKENIIDAVMVTVYNNVMFVLPAAIYQWIYRLPVPLPAVPPSLLEIFLGVTGNILMFDLEYYWWHRIHHRYKPLYKYIHQTHHKYNSPFSWTTQYLSPAELIAAGIFAQLNTVLMKQHFITANAATLFNIYISIDAHSGYDFPWAPNHVIPLRCWGGAPKHDTHHMKPLTNFAPFFSYLDDIFGTASEGGYCEILDPCRRQREILSADNKAKCVKAERGKKDSVDYAPVG